MKLVDVLLLGVTIFGTIAALAMVARAFMEVNKPKFSYSGEGMVAALLTFVGICALWSIVITLFLFWVIVAKKLLPYGPNVARWALGVLGIGWSIWSSWWYLSEKTDNRS